MEKALQNRVGYFFIGILLFTLAGFYKTYFIKFPAFEGFTSVHHFHGVMGLLWIVMLVGQAFLIRAKKYSLHRLVGKASYVVMPLLILSLFLVARVGYYRNIKTMSEADALAGLSTGIPDMFYMAILYGLGIIYKRNTAYHLRFFTSTGLLIMGPGLGRFLIVFCALPFQLAIPILVLSTTGTALIWMIIDIRRKKSAFPMLVFTCIGICAFLINTSTHSAWWQGLARWWVDALFY